MGDSRTVLAAVEAECDGVWAVGVEALVDDGQGLLDGRAERVGGVLCEATDVACDLLAVHRS